MWWTANDEAQAFGVSDGSPKVTTPSLPAITMDPPRLYWLEQKWAVRVFVLRASIPTRRMTISGQDPTRSTNALSAADMILEYLKNEDMKGSNKKKEIDDILAMTMG